jgi:hypothetical protein
MPDVSVTTPSNSIRLSVPTTVSLSVQQQTSQQPTVSTGVAHTVILEPTTIGEVGELSSGRLVNIEGFGLAIKDEIRNKVLSVEKFYMTAAKRGYCQNMALRVDGIATSLDAVKIPRDATILSAAITTKDSINSNFQIEFKKQNDESVASIPVPSGTSSLRQSGMSADLDADDSLTIFLSSDEPVDNPLVTIEIAWRL